MAPAKNRRCDPPPFTRRDAIQTWTSETPCIQLASASMPAVTSEFSLLQQLRATHDAPRERCVPGRVPRDANASSAARCIAMALEAAAHPFPTELICGS